LRVVQSFVLCVYSSLAVAQSTPTTQYIAARNQATQELGVTDPAVLDRHNQLEKTQGMGTADAYWNAQMTPRYEADQRRLRLLEPLLRRVIGPFSCPAVQSSGKPNVETLLADEVMFGRLDGIRFDSVDEGTQILVTTRALVKDWNPEFYELLNVQPAEILTQAWAMEDKHFEFITRFPMSKPRKAAYLAAFIGYLGGESANYVPDTVYAVLVAGQRVYLVSQAISPALPKYKECDQQWQALEDVNQDDAAVSTFNQCYADHVTSNAAYRVALHRAQQLINDIARR